MKDVYIGPRVPLIPGRRTYDYGRMDVETRRPVNHTLLAELTDKATCNGVAPVVESSSARGPNE